MQMNKPTSDYDLQLRESDDFADQFNRILQLDEESQEEFHECEDEEEYEVEVEVEEDDENDGDFTFMYVGGNDAPISPGKVFEDGQIRPVFPLFDQNLLLEDGERLPTRPPVDKVFIESPHHATASTSSEAEDIEGVAMGPYCSWSKESAASTPELSKKSNSTGFSKLWRFRDKVSRSNSDGRDAFVFLNNPNRPATSSAAAPTVSTSKPAAGDRPAVKVNATGGAKPKVVRKVKKSAAISAHEVYLKQKVGHTEEERRRSYLPYRPELMGFFTNVNGGLSRNVHPF